MIEAIKPYIIQGVNNSKMNENEETFSLKWNKNLRN